MAKTLLILGAGIDQIPGILKAKEMGLYTICLDWDEKSEGKKYCDEFHKVSIKHIDQIENFIESKLDKKVDGVIAFGVDIPYIISYVAKKLNVNFTVPISSAKLSEDKFESKNFMKENNIQIPKYKLVNSLDEIKLFIEEVGLPIVLKPVDNSASRGISFINSFEKIEEYYKHALENSVKKKCLVEKYLEGPQISTESFIVDGKVYNIGFADRNYSDMEKFLPNIIENGGDLPSIFMKEKHKKQLERYLEIIAKKLDIKNAVIKGDIVIHDDELHIVEFALRLSGGNFSTIEIPESTGVDFLKISIKLHMDLEVFENELEIKKNDFISLRYKFVEELKKGIVKDIKIPNDNGVIKVSTFLKKEDEITSNKTLNHANRIASVIMKGKNREDAIFKCNDFLNKMEIDIE